MKKKNFYYYKVETCLKRQLVRDIEAEYAFKSLDSSRQVYEWGKAFLSDATVEEFYSINLDNKNKVIGWQLVSRGSLTMSIVHPREVFKAAIVNNAANIVLIHNHPSGDPTPSREDISTTDRLREIGRLIGIGILDHIIIGDGCYLSFTEKSLL